MSWESVVLEDKPVVFYRNAITSGTSVPDVSGNSRNATTQNTPTLNEAGGLLSETNGAMKFASASKQYFERADEAALDLTDTFSIMAVIKASAWSANWAIAGKGSGAYYLRVNAEGKLELLRQDTKVLMVGKTAMATGAYYYVLATKTGATVALYQAKLEAGATLADVSNTLGNSTCVNTTVALMVGRAPGDEEYANGWIDEVAVFGTALSKARGEAHIAAAIETPTKSTEVAPPAAVAKAAAPAPTATTTSDTTVEPPAAVAKAVAPAPAVSAGTDATVSAPAATATAKAPAPTVTATQSAVVEPPAAVAKASAPAPTVETKSPPPPTRAAVTHEYPPDQLAWRVDPPNGAPSRWAADEPHNENVITDIQLTDDEHGDKEGVGTLARNPRLPWPDLAAFSEISVYGPGVEEVGSYRLDKAPESDGERMVISPAAVGHQALLDDDAAIIGPGFIDGDLSKWQDPSAARQALEAIKSWKLNKNGQAQILSAGTTEGAPPALAHTWSTIHQSDGSPDLIESWYDSGGVPIGRVLLEFIAAKGITPSALWENGLYSAIDDAGASAVLLGDWNGVSGAFDTPVAEGMFSLVLQDYFSEVADFEGQWEALWRYIKILGRHGLPLQGTWPNVGFTAKQMLGHAVPLYTDLTAEAEDLEDTSYIIQQAWYSDPGSMRAIVEDICKYDLYDWFVFGSKRFQLRKPGSYGREWLAYSGPSGLSEAGLDSSRLWRSIVVSFQDVDGTTKTVGPPGSGANLESANLEVTDPDHPAVRAGITRKDLLSLGTIATPTRAIEVGERFLVEANQLSRSGSCSLSGYAMESRGIMRPISQIRFGDRVRVVDASDTSPRKVVGRTYDHPSRTCQVTLDAPPESLQALVARMGADISALQLS